MQHQNGGDSGEHRFTILIVTCITQEFNGSIFEGVFLICSINRRNNSFKIACVLFVYWLQEERSKSWNRRFVFRNQSLSEIIQKEPFIEIKT